MDNWIIGELDYSFLINLIFKSNLLNHACVSQIPAWSDYRIIEVSGIRRVTTLDLGKTKTNGLVRQIVLYKGASVVFYKTLTFVQIK
ncbi:MAG: hypothetical protein DRI44_05325 [Chlamydiae bacterium]|nr:MAG: hypothetical protein DRI44_05325 [Chlamydiota bacterium]